MAGHTEIKSRFSSPLSISETAGQLNRLEALSLFEGYLLVPAISHATQEGHRRTTYSPKGKTRQETILVATDHKLWYEIKPAFPEKMMYKSIVEKFDFADQPSGCEVTRTMTLRKHPLASPLAWVGSKMLSRAIRKNNQALKSYLKQAKESGRAQRAEREEQTHPPEPAAPRGE